VPRPTFSPYGAYERAQRSGIKGRAAEALAFVRAANALEAACRPPVSRRALDGALKHNQKLWTLVQIEAAAADNPLPAEIRANLLDLSLFVDRQTIRALASGKADLALPLIEIDREIAAGLMAG
jgi:flagellar protein FlaF